MKRIILADDHHLVREAIANMLNKEKEIYVVSEVSNGSDLVKEYKRLQPELALIDIEMPVKNGINAAKEIINSHTVARLLFLSQFVGEEYIYAILKAGGHGLVSKSAMKGELLYAIDTVLKGYTYFGKYDDNELSKILNKFHAVATDNSKDGINLLTDREKEVLFYIGEGYTSIEIAEKLFISKRTVDFHRSNIMSKMKIKKSSELVINAAEFHNHFNHREKAV
ncbi:MAG: response regulator transcription factor [Melioribacteraceae bacterium]|nr:response regulator transcription factor [Melioribacteraceae bacterium]MCF8357038.1 response regulator transcription factor [Melioribacteraceae bacterium]MCF8396241.1 response regulator transcription factor [Melioribacteraceae bacterium]MCF8421164.1 response regulator transcription factor [Melioribacteraceae bacterium]